MTPDEVIAKLVDNVADLQRQINQLNRIEQPPTLTLIKISGRQGGSGTFWTSAGTNNYTPTGYLKMYIGMQNVTVLAGTKTANITITLPTAYQNSAFMAKATLRTSGANIEATLATRELTSTTFGVYITLPANVGVDTAYSFEWETLGQ
jgi:hypothetical protein